MADDLIHEVEESVRQDKINKFWNENGNYIIAGCILLVLFTGLISGWKTWNTKNNRHDTALVIAALDSETPVESLDKIIDKIRPGHKAIAHLNAAGILLSEKKYTQALTHYNAIKHDQTIKPIIRDLGTLMATKLEWALSKNSESESDPSALINNIDSIARDHKNPWYGHASIQAAIIAASLNDYTKARSYLTTVKSAPALPAALRQRAEALDHIYALKHSNNTGDSAE